MLPGPTMELPIEVDVTTAAQLMRDGALVVDVREPFELEIVQLSGAQHIPMRRIPEAVADLPADKPVLILCHVGGRSLRVTQFLRAHGRANVANIAGGIDAWAEQIDPTLARY